MLTIERLKSVLHYEPTTGAFTRIVSTGGKTKVGETIGTKQKSGHISAMFDGNIYYLHRLAYFYMTGDWPVGWIDHIDGNPSNNRWENLRVCNNSQNQMNSSKHSGGSSKYKGVYFHKKNDNWCSTITVKGKRLHLGSFKTELEAYQAYCEAAKIYFQDFARLS